MFMATKLETKIEGLPLIILLDLWSRDLARSSEKLKQLYLHYHKASGHKTWQESDLP